MNEFEKSIKVLGLKGKISKDTVKAAYKKLIKIHHPDFFTNKKNKAKATENFKKIQKAYEYLLEYIEDSTIDVGSKPKQEKTTPLLVDMVVVFTILVLLLSVEVTLLEIVLLLILVVVFIILAR